MKFGIRRKVAIDLGTTSILVYLKNKGVILKEPSVVAIDRFTDKIVAVGTDAKKMIGRTPGNIKALRPMRDGVIVDYTSTEKMLRYFLTKALGRIIIKPDVIVCVPSGATQVQKRAVMQAAAKAGANNIHLIEEPLAAGIGAGIKLGDPGGSMVVDIGGGTTDIAVISMGGIVVSESIRAAGDACDQAIIDYVRKHASMIIGENTAELIKINIGSVHTEAGSRFVAKGRDLFDGLPREVELNVADVESAISKTIDEISDAIHNVLSRTPPELASDIFESGIILTGGGALIKGIDKKIKDRVGINVTIDENALTSVARGAGRALNWIGKLPALQDQYFEVTKKEIARRERLRRR